MHSPQHEPMPASGGEEAAMSLTRRVAHLLVGALLIIIFAACGLIGSGTVVPTATPQTPLPTICASKATATAHSWVSGKQIVGSLNGGPVSPISNFVYPLGLPLEDVFEPTAPGFTTWAPNGKHLATLMSVLVPGEIFSYPYIVDTTTHVATELPLPAGMMMASPIGMEWARERSLAWADSNHLVIFAVSPNEIGGINGSQTTTYLYTLSTQTLIPLPGVTSALQGAVRCGTLYYLELTPMKQFQRCQYRAPAPDYYWYIGGADLRRYDLVTKTPIGQPYPLGATSSCPDFNAGEVDAMGWDITAGGKSLVYQQTVVSHGPLSNPPGGYDKVQTDSTFLVENLSNPSSPTPILAGAKSNANAFLAISPDQKSVAVVATDSLLIGDPSSALVYTGFMGGGAASILDPSAGGLPAWYADSTGFDTSGLWKDTPDAEQPYLLQFQLGMPHAVGNISGEHHPASLP